jgi:hypothetical protein
MFFADELDEMEESELPDEDYDEEDYSWPGDCDDDGYDD